MEVPEALMGEFDLAVQEVLAGPRTRLSLLEQEFKAIETRGLAGLAVILTAVRSSGGGQAARLMRTQQVFAAAQGPERPARLCQRLERLYGALELARLLRWLGEGRGADRVNG